MEHINYQFGEIIGVGGMSTVYKGTHKTLLKPVAIKVLKKEFINNVNIRKNRISCY
jgi:serine/threonine protein kinase